jgi:hypothetical protein
MESPAATGVASQTRLHVPTSLPHYMCRVWVSKRASAHYIAAYGLYRFTHRRSMRVQAKSDDHVWGLIFLVYTQVSAATGL